MNFDQDALVAAADLVGRSGAKKFEVGWVHDDVPIEKAGWYAHAQYRGARITCDDYRGPVEAAEALARRILDGGTCAHCGLPVRLSDSLTNLAACRWTREGKRWKRGCEAA